MKIILKISVLISLSLNTIVAQTWVKSSAPTDINYTDIRTYGKDIIYALGSSKNESLSHTLVSSFDGGQTWKVGTIKNYNWANVVATPSGLIIGDITTNPTTHYTADGGETWSDIIGNQGTYFFPGGILPNGKLLYCDQIFFKLSVSPDYTSIGASYGTPINPDFTKFATNPSGRIILGHDGNNGYDLAYSDDNGATLTNISLKNIIGTTKIAPFVTYAGNNTFYTAGVNTEVLKSTDNGTSWALCSSITSGVYIYSVKANQSSGRVLVNKSGTIYTSTDGGQTFNVMGSGLPVYSAGKLETTTDGKFWLTVATGSTLKPAGGIYYLQDDNLSVSNNKINQLSLYPNPAKDFINIDNLPKNTIVKIVDATGKLVQTFITKETNLKMNTSDFSNGIYFIEMNNNEKKSVTKFIVNK